MAKSGCKAFALLALCFALACGVPSAALDPQYASWADRVGSETSYRVVAQCANGNMAGGSGTAISKRQIVTAKHVLEACGDSDEGSLIMVTDRAGVARLVESKRGPDDDVAVLTLTAGDEFKSFAHFADELPRNGDTLCWWGGDANLNANGFKKCGFYQDAHANQAWLSGKGAPGNSGSGVLNAKGELVGVLVAGSWHPGRDFFIEYITLAPVRALL